MNDALKGLKEWSNAIQDIVKVTDGVNETINEMHKVDEDLAKLKPSSNKFNSEFPEEIRNMIRDAYGNGFDRQFERSYNEWIRLGYKPEDAVSLAWQSFLCSCVAEKEECDSAENEWNVSMSVKIIGSEFAKKLSEANQNFAEWMKTSKCIMNFVYNFRKDIKNISELDSIVSSLSKE